MNKQYWPNQWIFILAAIGSAAGLGNLWRFPYLAFEHGGGAFLLALLVANIVIGIPLLALEVGLGQKMQKGAADALGAVKSGFRYVGWMALFFSFLVIAYYLVVVSWGVNYFFSSFNLAWGADTSGYFFENLLQISSGPTEIGGISLAVFVGLVIAWVGVYFTVWKGVKSISAVVKWSATLPFVILAILIVRAVTLPGAAAGLAQFFIPVWSALLDPQLWLAALSQVFFSLSLAFGIMIAYGSLKERHSNITTPVLWIVAGNFIVSVMSGVVIFGTLGHMAHAQGTALSEVIAGGPSLAFVVFPEALNLLPAFAGVAAVLFFGTFLALALDSAFSLVEALATSFKDRLKHMREERVAFWIAVVEFILGIVFTTFAGIYLLDIVDHFVVSYGLVVIGLLEAVIVGWVWKPDTLRNYINSVSSLKLGRWWNYAVRYVVPLFLLILLGLNIRNELQTPYEGYPVQSLLLFGVLPILLVPLVAFAVDKLSTPQSAQ